MLSDTIEEYLSKINYHNLLIENIGFENYFFDGVSPIKRVRELKKEIKALEKYLPKDTIDNAPKLLEWNEQTMAGLEPDLRKAWIQKDKQVEKIKDFTRMYGYINHHYPNYNLPVVLITMSNNLGKICRNYVKHSNDDTKEVFDELKQLMKDAQLDKPTKAQINDHAGFKALQEKYPEYKFDEVREFSEAEKQVAHLRTEIVPEKRGVRLEDEKVLKQREKDLKKKPKNPAIKAKK